MQLLSFALGTFLTSIFHTIYPDFFNDANICYNKNIKSFIKKTLHKHACPYFFPVHKQSCECKEN